MMSLNTLSRIAGAVLATGLVATVAAASRPEPPAAPPKSEAETIAEKALKAGSDLFDAKDAAALAATYTEDGEILLVDKKDGEIKEEMKAGRGDIETFYRDLFAHSKDAIDSENTVEIARLISPEVLVIHGRFRPNTGQPELPFVQMRVKQGDRWLLSKLWLFLKPGRTS